MGRRVAVVGALVMAMVALEMVASCHGWIYDVGGPKGWNFPSSTFNYTKWAASKHLFHRKDQLRFKYNRAMHNLVAVDALGYQQCNTLRTIKVYKSTGNTIVPFNRKGTYYFICSVPGHCQRGMKIKITIF